MNVLFLPLRPGENFSPQPDEVRTLEGHELRNLRVKLHPGAWRVAAGLEHPGARSYPHAVHPKRPSGVRATYRALFAALLMLMQTACASTRTVLIVSDRPAPVKLTDGTPLCATTPCSWSFSRSVCGGPFHSYSPFVGFEVTEGEQAFRSPMVPFCELDEGEVIEVLMSANASLTQATIEFVDAPVESFVERAVHLSRAKVVALWLLPESERSRGRLKVELELEEPPLKGQRRDRHVTTFEVFHHPGRFARHLPTLRKTTLTVGAEVFYFDLGKTSPMTSGSHIENISDRGAEIRGALDRRTRG